jgi:hypothetical protein
MLAALPGILACGKERSMKPNGLAFTLIALGLAIGARPVPGQTIYFRQIAGESTVMADPSCIYVFGRRVALPHPDKLPLASASTIPRGDELWTREFTFPRNYVWRAAAVDAVDAVR